MIAACCNLNLLISRVCSCVICPAGKAARSKKDEDESESEDEDFEDNNKEDDISLDDDFFEEGEEGDDDDEEEEAATMPPKKKEAKAASTPVKKKAAPPSVDSVTDSVKKMSVSSSSKAWDFSAKYPFMMPKYVNADGRRGVSVEALVPTRLKEEFKVDTDGPHTLCISEIVPEFFYEKDRLMLANADDNEFTEHNHKATAFQDVAQDIQETHDFEETIWSAPEKFTLPFACEEEIVDWELQRFVNDTAELTDELGGQQFYTVMVVELVSAVKPKRKVRGRTRIIGTPQQAPMDEGDNAL